MTELERTLKNTLLRMEGEITATLANHDQSLNRQQHALVSQGDTLKELQAQIKQMTGQQQEYQRQLQGLSAVYRSLEPLLSRLNGLLSGK